MNEHYEQELEEKAQTISFLGVESYDIILYLARILSNFGKKILVIDVSDRGALTEALYDTSESQIASMEPCILNYQGIDFIPKVEEWICRGDFYNQFLYPTYCEYDYILVDYGLNIGHTAIEQSTLAVIITDMEKQNLKSLRPVMEQLDIPKEIIIRNIIPCKIKAKDLLSNQIRKIQGTVQYLEIDVNDLANKIQMQHTRLINLKKCSKRMKELLCIVVNQIEKNRTKKEILEVLSVTWRGK